MARIAPSILSADFARLADEVARVAPAVDMVHVDVMDGHFVPNITLGPPVVRSLRRHTELFLDCHLMITDPGQFLPAFKEAGADGCSVHVEVGHTAELLDQLRSLGMKAGLGVNPETPLEAAEPFFDRIDMLLLMTVHPGFGGQSFIEEVMPKVRAARRELDRRHLDIPIQVDGGVDLRTAVLAAQAGAEIFVAGSAVFGDEDPPRACRRICAAVEAVPA